MDKELNLTEHAQIYNELVYDNILGERNTTNCDY